MGYRISQIFRDFIKSETSSGYLLIFSAVVAFAVVNFGFYKGYDEFWHQQIGLNIGNIFLRYSLLHWVNDGLMTIFFLLIGLEIRRELAEGELSNPQQAILPIIAAIGGALLPAIIYFGFNAGLPTSMGFGIPMATDIAFTLAVLALVGEKAPTSLKIFLTALAIIDDLIAILVIAIFYSTNVDIGYLLFASGAAFFLYVLNRKKVSFLPIYLLFGLLIWYGFLRSGIHATISGVLFAFLIPGKRSLGTSLANQFEKALHLPVAFFILPLFSFANTGIFLGSINSNNLWSATSMGIILGLIIGKPIGIFAISFLAIKTKVANLSSGLRLRHLLGGSLLGGIGFTMSMFITTLAFAETQEATISKIAVVIGSFFAGIFGYLFLRLVPSESSLIHWRN